jgi:hydrogenase 3 maturation protease
MYILMGVGSELNGDDGVGNVVAREFGKMNPEGWKSLECETVPENFIGVVEREMPVTVVVVDAAEMGLPPGEFRRIPTDRLDSDIMGTHGIPLKHLVSRLMEHAREVVFIGIQPGKMRFGDELSPELLRAKDELIGTLYRKEWNDIKQI